VLNEIGKRIQTAKVEGTDFLCYFS